GKDSRIQNSDIHALVVDRAVHIPLKEKDIVFDIQGNVQKYLAGGVQFRVPKIGNMGATQLYGAVAVETHQAHVQIQGGIVDEIGVQPQTGISASIVYLQVPIVLHGRLCQGDLGEQEDGYVEEGLQRLKVCYGEIPA